MVPEGTTARLEGFFRYVDITPVTLQLNEQYHVGAMWATRPGHGAGPVDPDADLDAFRSTYNGTQTFGPGIDFIGSASSPQQVTRLTFPGHVEDSNPYLGPNFLYHAPAPSVPDAGSAMLGVIVLAGVLGLGANWPAPPIAA